MVFPVVMYGCESCAVRKAEHWRIDAFELWCWRRLLWVLWTARRSNQSILKVFIGRNDAKAETPVLWLPHAKCWLIGKDPDAGRDWGQEEKGMTEDEMAGWRNLLDTHEFEWTPGVVDGQRGLACCDSWGRTIHGVAKSRTQLSNWTELMLNSGIAGSYGNSIFSFFFREYPYCSQSSCTNVHSHQQCRKVPFSPHPDFFPNWSNC